MINPATSTSRATAASSVLCLLLAACGGGGSTASKTGSSAAAPVTASYTIGGSVSGLSSNAKLTLLDNGTDLLMLAASGAFTFAAPVALNAAYAVTVGTQPLWQYCAVSNGSGTATANVSNVDIVCATALADVATFAGSGARGSANGIGAAASFDLPDDVAVDTAGNVYVADTGNNLIRKITPEGNVTTLAGSGAAGATDGTGAAASFNGPNGLAVDAGGNVYVADTFNHEIRKITPAGVVTTLAGSTTAGSADGTSTAASFNSPFGVAVDTGGNVFVADTVNNEIRKVTSAGVVTTIAGSPTAGSADGAGAAASFNTPFGLAVDKSGNIYVADSSNNEIRKVTASGVVTTFAGSTTAGAADGNGTAASFHLPYKVTFDASGNLYVGDTMNYAIRRITPSGDVATIAGSGSRGSANGIGTAASFAGPTGVAVDANGNLYVSDYSNSEIRLLTPAAAAK
ncbi:NHL repeat-containing protein [Paraburkholderia sp. J7]|uniref:NHL repeat-containing protein n=1 Tax=Paraburkholderia sp. J7 TaxID=2805438 RepID=UPI002AB6630C|nr:NHL repeat-containing protein [Paraburkholderia sp. J7]